MDEDSRRAWVDTMPAAYERYLVPALFRPFADDLARRVAQRRPNRVLEVAAGTGVVTDRLVAELPSAQIVATDLNAAMVAEGRRVVPRAEWQPADATDLPFEDSTFDVVACQFGVMFFPDKRVAFRQLRRVLTPGGAVLFNTWAPVEEHGFAAALVAGLQRAFPDDPPTFITSIPHGYGDPGAVAADVEAAGFGEVRVETITLAGSAPSAGALATGFCSGTPLRAEISARGDLAATTLVIAHEMERLLGSGPVTAEMTAHVVVASAGQI